MRVYRVLVRLYPRQFRDAFADDLVAMLGDLERDQGRARAWWICTLDLLVTLPRMHLERIMDPKRTTTTITSGIGLLAVAGTASVLIGIYPGVLLLVAAAVLMVAQRSALARAVSVRDTALRHRRLRTAAVLAVVFVACYGVFVATVGDEWTARETVLAAVGSVSMLGAVVYLVVGLATRRDPVVGS